MMIKRDRQNDGGRGGVSFRSAEGASIIEIMISLVVVAMLLIAVVSVFPRMTAHRKAIHEIDQARVIAAEVLDGLQALSRWEDICPIPPSVGDFVTFKNQYAAPREMGAVKFQVEPTSFSTGIDCTDDMNTATVTVSWTKAGKNHKVTVKGAIK